MTPAESEIVVRLLISNEIRAIAYECHSTQINHNINICMDSE